MFGFDPNYDPAAHEPTDDQVQEQIRTLQLREAERERDADLGIENLPRHEREQEREFCKDFARAVAAGTGGG